MALCWTSIVLVMGIGASSLPENALANDEDDKELIQKPTTTIKISNGVNEESVSIFADRAAKTTDGVVVEGLIPRSPLQNMNSTALTLRPDADSGPFSVAAHNERPIEKWLLQMLDKPVTRLEFPGEVRLSKVLAEIADQFNGKYGKTDGRLLRMTFWPDTPELDLEGVPSLEDVTVHDIDFEGIMLRDALKLIFDQTTAPEMTYSVQYGVYMVSTLEKVRSTMHVYARVSCRSSG